MATVVAAPPGLSGDLSLFYTTDPFLANAPVLIFHGLAVTVGAASSRIQLHVFTTAGYASFNRLAVSPSSPFYSAVSNLPREEQGDETIRSIAFGLRKYFAELPKSLKEALGQQVKALSTTSLFGDEHVAILASRLNVVQNTKAVSEDLVRSFAEQKLSWTDVDVILPPGSVKQVQQDESRQLEDFGEEKLAIRRYGKYAEIINAFGNTAFLPTSKLKRAPSKVSSIGRTASFLRQQKERARQEVLEFVSTEQNYVSRLQELDKLRHAVEEDGSTSSSFRNCLPKALPAILQADQDLLAAVQDIISSTATSSAAELQTMKTEQPTAQQIRQDLLADNQGIVAFAKCLCERLPSFREPYASYTAEQDDSLRSIRAALRVKDAASPNPFFNVGEQRLTSLLIEPIQRLPRYSLYIDEISKQLPARHPALKFLLQARDIVTSICDEGDDNANDETITAKLRARIDGWPEDLTSIGRLITAVDYACLRPPYDIESSVLERGMLLLTPDGVAMVEKLEHRTMSARAFMTEIEASRKYANITHDFVFLRWLPLSSIECTEGHEGQSINLTLFPEPASRPAETSMVLLLEGSLEGKAARLIEDIAKARVEARFSEEEREGIKWEVRATHATSGPLRLFSAIFEDSNASHVGLRTDLASVRVVVDVDRHSQRYRASKDGAHTIVTLSPLRDGTCRVSTYTVEGASLSEQISMSDMASTLPRRVANALAARHNTIRTEILQVHIHRNRDILQSIQLQFEANDGVAKPVPHEATDSHRPHSLRPLSPVKMLSSLLSSSIGPGSQPPVTTLKKKSSGSAVMKAGAGFAMLQPKASDGQISSAHSNPQDQLRPKSSSSARSFMTIATSEPAKKLENTLSAYVLALKARKGNIVSRNLKMRADADELAINELYNQMLENHQTIALAAQASVDVLLAAFEKFVRVAWADQLGPVLSMSFLGQTRSKAETLLPSNFDEYFRAALTALSSSNQFAFREIINLLNELLDGTGNDADRGALTVAFAEVLVPEGDAHDYIVLIDKFVDDADTYFGEPLTESMLHTDVDLERSTASHKRSRSVNTGSLTSNTSSLRRKFGLGGLSRENSRSENESKSTSVWRTLSKSRSKEASPGSTLASRGTLQRALSTDSESRLQSRPVSSDGQHGQASNNGSLMVPTLQPAVLPGLTTIGEHPSFIPTGPPRKKRRSSLSDLKLLATPFATPQKPAQSSQGQPTNVDKQLPSSPVASTPSSKSNSLRLPTTPSRITPRPALPASFRQEIGSNTSPKSRSMLSSTSTLALPISTENAPSTTTSPSGKQRQSSNIPTLAPRANSPSKAQPITPLRVGLSERSDGGNIIKQPSPWGDKMMDASVVKQDSASPTKRLRMQSPQKIRERLQTEQAAIAAAHCSLQDELSKLGDELALTPSRLQPSRSTSNAKLLSSNGVSKGSVDMAARIIKLETTLSKEVALLTSKLEKIQGDVTSSLSVSEAKSKKLDELYKEANAENEALYSRFNDELARVLKAVRGGEGVEQLKQRLKQQDDEVARLKRDNVRLKREAAGLRSQLRE